ncbi:hypothetical protein [Chryseobacterium wanjuense]
MTDAAEQNAIEFSVDNELNLKKMMTKLSVLYGLASGSSVFISLVLAQYSLSEYYKLDATAMAVLVGVLAGFLSILFTYLPIWKLRKYLYKSAVPLDTK